jgi:hypothetical protein
MYPIADHARLGEALLRQLRIDGSTPAADLRAALGVSQPTFSRLVGSLRSDLVISGRARATRYAARRVLPGVPASLPLYEVTGSRARLLATLTPIHPRGFVVESDTPLAGVYPDLPWFLHDLRPSGFLGRLVPLRHPELPRDILRWSTDEVVRWLYTFGGDLIGNLILGEPAFQRYLGATLEPLVDAADRPSAYARLAAEVLAGGEPGSSAGGEQPKFLATRVGADGRVPVLVKFSPPVGTPVGRRVADLLIAEHLALECIREAGRSAARSAIVRGGERVFLEVERFDRHEHGRHGIVSLLALDMEFVGRLETWTVAAEALHAARRIGREALEQVVWMERFGEWIGNTDRHLGNLSFRFESGVLGGLAPVYDMLPMRYAPRSGEIVPSRLPMPALSPAYADTWRDTWTAALRFWGRVVSHPQISGDFAAIAWDNEAALRREGARIERLPLSAPSPPPARGPDPR